MRRSSRATFTASAAGPSNLECATNTTTNPDWMDSGKLFQLVETECAPASVEVETLEVKGVA